MGDGYIINRGNIDAPSRLPMFKYTGRYRLTDEGLKGETRNWNINFYESGEFTPADDLEIEVLYLVNGHPASRPIKRTLTARTAYNVVAGNVARLGFVSTAGSHGNGGGVVKIRNAR